MSLFDRFFGRKSAADTAPEPLVANAAIEETLSLQVVFHGALELDPDQLQRTLRGCHKELAAARVELDPETVAQGTPLGLIGWGSHVIQLVAFDGPLPRRPLEQCLQPSHYAQELKGLARAGQSHALLYYRGYAKDPLERYVTLAAVAGCMEPLGGLVVLNETAHTSLPISVVAPGVARDTLRHLRELPLLFLYAGFVKEEAEGEPGVWMRTYGCECFGLPNLATHRPSHDWGQTTFETFCSLLDYLRKSGARFRPGETSQVGEDEYYRFREPRPEEGFLQSEGTLLVAEVITKSEINQ